MIHLEKETSALHLVDFQRGFENEEHWGGNRNNRDAEKNARRVLDRWRELGMLVFHAQHDSIHDGSPLHPANPGNALVDALKPVNSEPLFRKNVNSAFIGTELQSNLAAHGIQSIVIMGMTTNHCVSTTARMASNLGYKTIVVSDATAAFDRVDASGKKYDSDVIHNVSLANLHDEFAEILTTDELLERLKGAS